MDIEVIDDNIALMADNLDRGASEQEIIEVYAEAGFQQDEIFLLLMAAKIIHHDRKTAIKPQGMFRRSQ
jgi:hypothetical protein